MVTILRKLRRLRIRVWFEPLELDELLRRFLAAQGSPVVMSPDEVRMAMGCPSLDDLGKLLDERDSDRLLYGDDDAEG